MLRKIKFLNYATETPLIPVHLGDGTEVLAVIDTGSETTLVDVKLVKDKHKYIKILKDEEPLNLVGLTSNSVSKPISVSMCTWKQDLQIQNAAVISMDHVRKHFKQALDKEFPYIIIVGSDVLSRMEIKLDFKKKELSFPYDPFGK